jgi:hypothetical protein
VAGEDRGAVLTADHALRDRRLVWREMARLIPGKTDVNDKWSGGRDLYKVFRDCLDELNARSGVLDRSHLGSGRNQDLPMSTVALAVIALATVGLMLRFLVAQLHGYGLAHWRWVCRMRPEPTRKISEGWSVSEVGWTRRGGAVKFRVKKLGEGWQ